MYYFSKGRIDIVLAIVSDLLHTSKLTGGSAIKIVKTWVARMGLSKSHYL